MEFTDSGPRDFTEAVHPQHTALVLHDVQNDFCTEGGKIYRRAVRAIGGGRHAIATKRAARQHSRDRRETERDLIDRVEERLLVFLQIAVVRER